MSPEASAGPSGCGRGAVRAPRLPEGRVASLLPLSEIKYSLRRRVQDKE